MTFTPLFLSELNSLCCWSSLWLTRFIYPKKHYTFDTYRSSVLDSVAVSLSVLQTVVCRWWDIWVYCCSTCAGQFTAQSPVPSPVERQGSSWKHSHHSSAWHWISTQLWPTRVSVSCWLGGITGSRGRLLGLISGDHSYSEAGTHFPVLGYLQQDSLDDTVDKTITALGSQGWLCPCRSLRAQLQQWQQ